MRHTQVHFFLLNDDADKNINGVLNLLKDSDVNRDISDVHIYCHTLKSPKTHWMESYDIQHLDNHIKIHVVDSSFLAVQTMKSDVMHHPVQFVDIDSQTATVTSPFNSLIVGFGETGKEYFEFLYEFGAFVNKEGKKSDFHCTVIDSRMSEIKGDLFAAAPGRNHLVSVGNYDGRTQNLGRCFRIFIGKLAELVDWRIFFQNNLTCAAGVDFQRVPLANPENTPDFLRHHHSA